MKSQEKIIKKNFPLSQGKLCIENSKLHIQYQISWTTEIECSLFLAKIFAQEVEAMTPQPADILIIKHHESVGLQIRRNLTRAETSLLNFAKTSAAPFIDRM